MKIRLLYSLVALTGLVALAPPAAAAPRWTPEKAQEWGRRTGWLAGCNFSPSTAINQLEMWQADTFDLATIDRELGWAEGLGFNSVRVFLHDLLWKQDRKGLCRRIDQFLATADKHHIGVMFVLFDSCWDPHPHLGRQHDPAPHLHNSGWVQSPGREVLQDPAKQEGLKDYVQGLLRRYGKDRRVQVWDLMNEPDNINRPSYVAWEPANKPDLALAFLKKVFAWAQEANPDQPLTSGVWIGFWTEPDRLRPMERLQLGDSDVVTYHNYGPVRDQQKCIESLRRYGRPILCTEYMARPIGSTFQTVLPFLKEQGVAAYNWGFVAGKTQTIYPWDSWEKKYTGEPPLWFHDIFRADGSAYRDEEVRAIRQVTGKPAPAAAHPALPIQNPIASANRSSSVRSPGSRGRHSALPR